MNQGKAHAQVCLVGFCARPVGPGLRTPARSSPQTPSHSPASVRSAPLPPVQMAQPLFVLI
jgi:hypothetical protein